MRDWLIEGEKLYCDWFINVTDCEENSFFYICAFINMVVGFVCTVICASIFVIRFFLRKDAPKSFFVGGNATLTAIWIVSIASAIHNLLLVLGVSTKITIITFAFPNSFGNLVHFTFFNSVLDAHLNFTSHLHAKASSKRRKIFYTLFLFSFLLSIALLSASSYFSFDPSINNHFYRAGTSVIGATVGIISVVFLYFASRLISELNTTLKLGKTIMTPNEDDKKRVELLVLAAAKIKRVSVELMIVQITTGIMFLLIGNYRHFFMNLNLSKGFCVIILCVFPISVTIVLILSLLVDLRRNFIETSLNSSHSGSHNHSKKASDVNTSEKATEKDKTAKRVDSYDIQFEIKTHE